jgi:hypothetical protein
MRFQTHCNWIVWSEPVKPYSLFNKLEYQLNFSWEPILDPRPTICVYNDMRSDMAKLPLNWEPALPLVWLPPS